MKWTRLLGIAVISTVLCGAEDFYLKLRQTAKEGKTHLTAENISGKPIVAYVVVVQHKSGQTTTVHSGVYTGNDRLAAGSILQLANLEPGVGPDEWNVFIDYVRLEDGRSWGDPITEQGKATAARFNK